MVTNDHQFPTLFRTQFWLFMIYCISEVSNQPYPLSSFYFRLFFLPFHLLYIFHDKWIYKANDKWIKWIFKIHDKWIYLIKINFYIKNTYRYIFLLVKYLNLIKYKMNHLENLTLQYFLIITVSFQIKEKNENKNPAKISICAYNNFSRYIYIFFHGVLTTIVNCY